MTTIELPIESAPLLAVVRIVLQGDVPDAALIGGLAVTARVTTSAQVSYRATADIDFVTNDDATPTLIEILSARHDTRAPIVIDGIKVDVIPTYEISEADLEGIDDGPRLFVASHRWALDTAEPVTMTCAPSAGPITVDVRWPRQLRSSLRNVTPPASPDPSVEPPSTPPTSSMSTDSSTATTRQANWSPHSRTLRAS